MSFEVTVTIGGEAGQGIQTVGDLLGLVCHGAGLYVMAINDFESRIRGGHSFFQIRISDRPIQAPRRPVHLLVCMDAKTYDLHRHEVVTDGLILMDEEISASAESAVRLPINALAKQAGGKIMANTVAAAACLSLLGAPFDLLDAVLKKQFDKKDASVAADNIKAADLGFKAVADIAFKWKIPGIFPTKPEGKLLTGAKAFALGAVAADCRFAAFYPMSPATGIIQHLSEFTKDLNLVVEQAEDEIAAINMIIGAAFAGARSLTATSGGGFCLMTEALGLAGITETPIVVINAQRPGPATGMATRTGQGDLLFVIRAAPDEFPRFVFAPATVEDAFEIAQRAFELADKYQTPVIILTDQYLNDSVFVTASKLLIPAAINRYIVTDADMDDPGSYKRYALASDGVSPRALPCSGHALVMVSGNEHRPDGHSSEAMDVRVSMVDKRNAKLDGMIREMNPPRLYHQNSKNLLVTWGSTAGAVIEAVDLLRKEGVDVGCAVFTDIWPFPAETAKEILGKTKRFITVENNSLAQFGRLICEQTGLSYTDAILRYDGRPMFPEDIIAGFNKIVSGQASRKN
jgi:2-oxoglutarate/2-oxoacid ferredoxin oxidoreductase subunit alpha